MEKLTHWKKTVDKDWIGTYILPEGLPIVVKLLRVEFKKVKVKGVEGEYKIAYFEKNEWFDKPMLLSANKNLDRIAKLSGTPYIERWGGLNMWVTLQQEMDQAFGGGKDWALRIASTAPQIKTIEDYPTEKELLFNCESMEELGTAFKSLSRELKALFNDFKNNLKTKFDENS